MTPKEKAIELVQKFSSVLMHDELYDDSIKCALIAVDEILQQLHIIYQHHERNLWEEVKQEINNL
jgi:hypothetical protein